MGEEFTDRWATRGQGYFIIALGTCFFVMGAVGIVTAAFLDNLFGISAATGFNATPAVAVAVFALATGLLTAGELTGAWTL